MQDICIYTTQEILIHKQEDGLVYWQFKNLPANAIELEKDGRIYFAINGLIVGYFLIIAINWDGSQIEWDSDSWVDLKEPIPQRPFQGFKYIKREG